VSGFIKLNFVSLLNWNTIPQIVSCTCQQASKQILSQFCYTETYESMGREK